MKAQEAAVYRGIQRSTEKAMKALDTISDKVYDDQLALQMSRQSLNYSRLHDEATKELVQARAQSYRSSYLQDMALKGSIHYNTLLNTSTGHLAELMIRESNEGIVEMERILNHNEEAGERPLHLARQLIDMEESNIARLKRYL